MTYNDGRNDDHRISTNVIALWALLLLFTAGLLGGLLIGWVLWH